jgi:endonuclease/exonuclease/phosphatase family metal-dependent hydrolase
MTLNTRHGGEPPWSAQAQIAEIVAEAPDVVLLQEASYKQLKQYVNGINDGLQTRAWHGELSRHCRAGTPNRCTRLGDESVMVLSRLKFESSDRGLIWAPDDAWVARAVVRAAVRAEDGTIVQVFSCHLPAGDNSERARRLWVEQFVPWASRFGGPRIVGGDFNAAPGSAAVALMKRDYVDAWAAQGRGSGGTETEDDRTYARRFDYFFGAAGARVDRAYVPRVKLSDHRPLVAVYTIAPSSAPAR